jgi:membrane protein YdbS with pleckstrin-like domain
LFVFDFPIWAILAPVPILIAISWTLTVWAPVARYRRFCYQVNADEVYIQHGIFVTKQSVVPMSKIQYVHSYQGPLLKAYGLKTVTISTGATSHEIPCLHEEEAEQLRTQLAVFARVVE